MENGFIVGKWEDPDVYAAVPCGKGLMVIHKNEQLKFCRTESSARNFIQNHKKANKKIGSGKGTLFPN
jgi:hypothetical protein